jgi:hypothetical protein
VPTPANLRSVPLELEPAPPEPPSAPRPDVRAHRIGARRARTVEAVRRVRGRVPSLVRSACASAAAHVVLFGLLRALWQLAPRTEDAESVIRVSLTPYVEAADPEAQAGGRSPRAEAPQGETAAAKAETPGLLLDDDEPSPTIGAGTAPGGSAFLGRLGGKERLLESGGGDGVTEGALRLALAWLARHQAEDGTWNAATFGTRCEGARCEGAGEAEYVDAVTALALLPYLGAGHTHRDGPWKDTVRRGLRALVARQREDGSFGADGKRGYATAIATLAGAEAYGLTRSEPLREPAQRAVDHLVRTQSLAGGWRYAPGDGATDSSVTGWATVALCAARRAGLDVPDGTLGACRGWFAGVLSPEGDVGYLGRGGGSAGLLGVGAFSDVLLGVDPAAPVLAPTFEMLERRLPRPPRGVDDNSQEYGVADPIHWYYGALAAFQRGGPTWNAWNARLRDTLLGTQVRDDTDARGSWPVMGATGRHGGRVVTTALCALCLEVYYRYPRATLR